MSVITSYNSKFQLVIKTAQPIEIVGNKVYYNALNYEYVSSNMNFPNHEVKIPITRSDFAIFILFFYPFPIEFDELINIIGENSTMLIVLDESSKKYFIKSERNIQSNYTIIKTLTYKRLITTLDEINVYYPDKDEYNVPSNCSLLSLNKNLICNKTIEMKKICLNKSIDKLDDYCFNNIKINEIYIPKNVSYMGSYCFRQTDLKSIIFCKNPSNLQDFIIKPYCFQKLNINITEKLNFVAAEEIYNELNYKVLGSKAFDQCNITNENLTLSYNWFNKNAFNACHFNKLLLISNNMKTNCFSDCTFKQVKIYENVAIDQYCFYNCTFDELIIDTPTLPQECFKNCIIKKIIFDNCRKVAKYAFSDVKNLYNVKLSFNMIQLGMYCFSKSTLTCIRLPYSITNLGKGCFENCKNLSKVIFFRTDDCQKLQLITIPTFCFKNTALVEFNLNSDSCYVCDYAFENCSKLESFYHRGSTIQENAFKNSPNVNVILF